jgi:hypothetical protein
MADMGDGLGATADGHEYRRRLGLVHPLQIVDAYNNSTSMPGSQSRKCSTCSVDRGIAIDESPTMPKH